MFILETLQDIYYKYFATPYISGYEYRINEIHQRILQDRNGYEY